LLAAGAGTLKILHACVCIYRALPSLTR
jgi:hypothetical protein